MSRSYSLNVDVSDMGLTAHHAAQIKQRLRKATATYRRQKQKISDYRLERREERALKRLQRRLAVAA